MEFELLSYFTIKYIPYPLIIGFTTGIAVIIFSSEIKDFLGLKMGSVPADFISKWLAYGQHLSSINLYAIATGVFTLLIVKKYNIIYKIHKPPNISNYHLRGSWHLSRLHLCHQHHMGLSRKPKWNYVIGS